MVCSLSVFLLLPDKVSSQSWMTVDTALFVTSAGKSKEECNLVCFTEARDEEVSVRVHNIFQQWWGVGLAALTASALTSTH